MSQTLITQLRAMQERECASLGDMADQTAGRAADALEREMQRAEAAEAQLKDAECCVTKYARAGERAKARISELEELHSMQLAAISTATIQNTVKSTADRIPPDNPYSTVAYADVCRAVDREMRERQRAEAAEARVAELEAQIAEVVGSQRSEDKSLPTWAQVMNRVALLAEQNARLRAALEGVSLLAHCISKAGPLNTPDLETAWRKFDLISVKAAEALVDRKAVLNGEEASK